MESEMVLSNAKQTPTTTNGAPQPQMQYLQNILRWLEDEREPAPASSI